MTNIFNKNILSKNGTLIENWFEERILRDATGEGRTVPKNHVPKQNIGEELIVRGEVQKDITSIRCLGDPKENKLTTSYQEIGNFSTREHKYLHGNIKDKVFKEFFSSYLDSKSTKDILSEEMKANYRSLETTKGTVHKPQEIKFAELGKRHMKTPDGFPIDQTKLDKLFMASHGMSKYQSIIPESKAKQYVGEEVPYFKDKEITFWSQNIAKGSFYTSPLQGQNAFARSSGFTQPVTNTKNNVVMNGKIEEKKSAKGILLDENDQNYIAAYLKHKEAVDTQFSCAEQVRNKILLKCADNGWIGIRKLRIYFMNLKKRQSSLVDKADFKYFMVNFGILLNDSDVNYIFQAFDVRGRNQVCFNSVLDWVADGQSADRLNWIEEKYNSLKDVSGNVRVSTIEKRLNPDEHPEVAY